MSPPRATFVIGVQLWTFHDRGAVAFRYRISALVDLCNIPLAFPSSALFPHLGGSRYPWALF